MSIRFTKVERVSHEEDRIKEARYWAARSVAERVIAGWELAYNNLLKWDDHEPEERSGITLRRISRSGR